MTPNNCDPAGAITVPPIPIAIDSPIAIPSPPPINLTIASHLELDVNKKEEHLRFIEMNF